MSTIEWPQPLSNILGAYDEGKWEAKVIEFLTGTAVLKRGSVISLDAGGKGVLAAAGNEDNAYGILLDEKVDTAVGTPPVGSVARAGSFKANQLWVAVGTDVAKLSAALRKQGVFLEGDLVVPSA